MPVVEAHHIYKSYADKVAVDDLSFSVVQNEIFGLIGPNGAGKTSTIRMMMDIIKPDSGEITVFGEKLTEASKNRLGYLPEERGLYKKLTVIDTIVYLASLKGMAGHAAREKADQLLARTGMLPYRRKKINELSKGMGQLIQFIVTIIHDPELVVLDEAFSGLDPVNTELLKEFIVELRDQGKAVVMSTHQMNQIEELCDRLLMVNDGRAVLYGGIAKIKARYRRNAVIVDFEGELGHIPGTSERHARKGHVELALDEHTTPGQVLERLASAGAAVQRFEVATPSLNDIFLEVVGKSHE